MQKTTKDLYKLLGLPRGASQYDVRNAHRKYHPDANPGDCSAEERFKEIQQAYEALSNHHRKRKYDELLRAYPRGNGWRPRAEAGGKTGGQSTSAVDLSELLSKSKDLIRDVRTGELSVAYKDVSGGRPSGVDSNPGEKRVKGPVAQGKRRSD